MNVARISYGGKKYEIEYYWPAEAHSITRLGTFKEKGLLDWVKKKKIGGVYYDCGAHVGNHTFFFTSLCKPEIVHSFEAHPDIFRILQRNNTRFGSPKNLVLENAAVWDFSGGFVCMSDIPVNHAGCTSIVNKETPVRVSTIALDDVTFERYKGRKIGLIKIDVEKREMEVLKGANTTIAIHRPVVIVERHKRQDHSILKKFFSDKSYSMTASWEKIDTYAWEPR